MIVPCQFVVQHCTINTNLQHVCHIHIFGSLTLQGEEEGVPSCQKKGSWSKELKSLSPSLDLSRSFPIPQAVYDTNYREVLSLWSSAETIKLQYLDILSARSRTKFFITTYFTMKLIYLVNLETLSNT